MEELDFSGVNELLNTDLRDLSCLDELLDTDLNELDSLLDTDLSELDKLLDVDSIELDEPLFDLIFDDDFV